MVCKEHFVRRRMVRFSFVDEFNCSLLDRIPRFVPRSRHVQSLKPMWGCGKRLTALLFASCALTMACDKGTWPRDSGSLNGADIKNGGPLLFSCCWSVVDGCAHGAVHVEPLSGRGT